MQLFNQKMIYQYIMINLQYRNRVLFIQYCRTLLNVMIGHEKKLGLGYVLVIQPG